MNKIAETKTRVNTVSEALYVLNKRVKQIRDQRTDMREKHLSFHINEYGEEYPLWETQGHKEIYRDIRDEANHIYYTKERALLFAVARGEAKILGYHEFLKTQTTKDGVVLKLESKIKRDYVEWDGFYFHLGQHTSDVLLGEIEGEISSEKKGVSISIKEAHRIVEDYLNEIEDKIWEKIEALPERIKCTALLADREVMPAYRGEETWVLLKDISIDGEVLIQKNWLREGKWSKDIKVGTKISLKARIKKTYYIDAPTEYGIERPTKVEIIE